MYEELDKDTMKYEILPPFVLGKTRSDVKQRSGGSYSMRFPQTENRVSMVDYFCVCMMLLSLSVGSMPNKCSPWPSQTYMFFVPLPTRAYLLHISFVSFSARNLTL